MGWPVAADDSGEVEGTMEWPVAGDNGDDDEDGAGYCGRSL